MSPLPDFLKPYFWDVDFKALDPDQKALFVIKRVIDRGDTKALRWLMRAYTKDQIRQLILTTSDISRKTASFWTKVLNLDPDQVPCLLKPYNREPFTPSS